MFGSMQKLIIFPVQVFNFRFYAMMDNTLAKNAETHPKITQQSSHPAAIFFILTGEMPER